MVVLLLITLYVQQCEAVLASPRPFRMHQSNMTLEPLLYLHGDASCNYLTDDNGFTVMRNSSGMLVYALRNNTDGNLIATDMVVGMVDPTEMNMTKHILPSEEMMHQACGRMCDERNGEGNRRLQSSALQTSSLVTSTSSLTVVYRKNLVLLIRFSNHARRQLPSPSDIDILFNNHGSHSRVAPTGSVRDVFLTSSLGKFDLESVVYPKWIDLPETEQYYAGGNSGLSILFMEAVSAAIKSVDSDRSFSLQAADGDGDSIVDVLTLLHSGYGAESGGTDGDGQSFENRIWSHKYVLPSLSLWSSWEGLKVKSYSVCPSLFGTSGQQHGRIGGIAHEIGHVLGVPDLYGGSAGNGLGSYGLMANSWGFDSSQFYPPIMCPWTKKKIGWLEPKKLVKSGRYSIKASAISDDVYQIDLNEAGTEYLLVENRQPISFDAKLPQGGLAIWHVDEAAVHRADGGWPGQQNWPSNSNHYRVALIQADGDFDLERANNRGDGEDLFHANGIAELLPSTLNGNRHPNTDIYQGGLVRPTGVSITDISASAETMQFSVTFDGEPPIITPVQESVLELKTPFEGGNGASGVMFDVLPLRGVKLVGISMYTYSVDVVQVEIYMKAGSYVGSETASRDWVKLSEQRVQGKGIGNAVPLTLLPTTLKSKERIAFYVTLTTEDKLAYTNGKGTGTPIASNSHLQIMEGVGKSFPFANTYRNRQWNGALSYTLDDIDDKQSLVPTLIPTSSPTLKPTSTQSTSQSSSLLTTFIGGAEQAGNMFDVLAFRDVFVTSFDLHISLTDEVTVEIYTKMDSYSGREEDCGAWTPVASIKVHGNGRGRPTSLPPNSFAPILLSRYLIRSFYITIKTVNPFGMRYSRGSGSGSLVSSDDSLAIFEGVGKGYPCARTLQDRVWNGVIHYLPKGMMPVAESQSEPAVAESSKAESSPAATDTLTWMTTFVGGRRAAGVMFDLVGKRTAVIVGMSLHIDHASTVQVEIYTKAGSYLHFETIPRVWTKILSTGITGQGRGNKTTLPANSFNPITLHANNTMAVYITCTGNTMRSSTGDIWIESNDAFSIANGVGKSYPFGRTYHDRVWNGIIEYFLV
jgi:M6 family metalloprotease-like protein